MLQALLLQVGTQRFAHCGAGCKLAAADVFSAQLSEHLARFEPGNIAVMISSLGPAC